MILSKYNEIMEHITVSNDMKNRIINNLQNEDLTESKIVRFPNMKRYIALVACFVLLLVGTFTISQMNKQPQIVGEQTSWGTVEYKNAKDLSEASGIKIDDLNNIPFEVTETIYQDYKCNLVEIAYSNETNSLYYRVSKGNEDNSGDYNDYSNVYQQDINGVNVTLKGDNDLIFCVLCENGGYSYSIVSTNGLTVSQIEKMI